MLLVKTRNTAQSGKKRFLNVRFICHYIIQNCIRFLVTHE